ncbi:hypothetical protein WJ16_30565 [Burkholderia metallica]|nr:hypothetical protein WJ16_30565 [Burkholderia metallica]
MRSSATHIAPRGAPIRIGRASLYDNFTSVRASLCSDECASHAPVKSMIVQKEPRGDTGRRMPRYRVNPENPRWPL